MRRMLALLICLMLSAGAASAETFAVSHYISEEYRSIALLIRDDGTPLTPTDTYQTIFEITPKDTPDEDRLFAASPARLEGNVDIDALLHGNSMFGYYWALVDAGGRQLTGFEYSSLEYESPGTVLFMQSNECCGAMDASGQILIPAEYTALHATDSGWLALDAGGREVHFGDSIPLVFLGKDGAKQETGLHSAWYGLSEVSDGICALNAVSEYGGRGVYLDEFGRVLFGKSFETAGAFQGNLAVIQEDGLQGLIDRDGRIVVAPTYETVFVESTPDGYVYLLCDGGHLTALNGEDGSVRFEKHFDDDHLSIWMPNSCSFAVTAGDVFHFFDLNGTELASIREDENIDFYYSGFCSDTPGRMIRQYGEWPFSTARLVDLDGREIGDAFQSLNGLSWKDGCGLYQVARYRVRRDSTGEFVTDWRRWRYGLCDQDGRMLLDAVYDSIEVLSENRFWVTQGGRAGMIDLDGRWYYAISDYEELMD